MSKKFVSLDLETCLIEAGRLDPDIVCAQVCDETLEPELVDHMHAEQVIADLLACPDVYIVGANVAFDFGCIIREYPALKRAVFAAYAAGRVLDVQIAQRLIDIANGELEGGYNHLGVFVKHYYSLAALHERWGLGSLAKDGTWRLKYGTLRGVPLDQYPEEAVRYALDDAAATIKVWMLQWHSFPHFLTDLAAQTRAAFALHLMSVRGIHTDADACDEYLVSVKEEIEAHKRLLLEHKLLRTNGTRDTKAAQAFMVEACERAGVEIKRTKKDGVCMDAEACRDVNDPVMTAYSSFVSAKGTLQRTEKLKLGSGAVPLQTRFQPLVNNGRSSSMEPGEPMVGMNLQNVPTGSKMRHVFQARPRKRLNSVDFSGAELHSFAQVEFWFTGKSLIGEALNAGRDLHCHLGAALLGVSYEEMFANKANGKYAWARKVCKNANFGLLGAMGAEKFMTMTNKNAKKREDRITIELAEQLRALWFDTWQTRPYFDHISSMLQEGAASVQHFISGRIRGKVTYTECANGFFSGLTADAFKAALWDLTVASYADDTSILFGNCDPLLAIHDEIIAEITDDPSKMHEVAFEQARVMVDAHNRFTPDFPVRAKPAVMRHWFKKAEDVFDANGRIRCWEPQIDDQEFSPKNYLKSTLIELA